MPKVLVLGFYKNEPGFNGNLGDNLFREAFPEIFPFLDFTFTDKIKDNDPENYDAIFFGGGSFLDGQPNFSEVVLKKILKKKIFYIGIGNDASIHSWHKQLLAQAQFIACRSNNWEKLKLYNNNVSYCPDLAFSLAPGQPISVISNNNKALILPNAYLISKWNDPSWKHISWEYFKSEFAQFLEILIEKKYDLDFLPMCQSKQINDEFAAIEIMNKMKKTYNYLLPSYPKTFRELYNLISSYKLIITQRYHGIILSQIAGISCLNIHHHSKLKNTIGRNINSISYYQVSKDILMDKIDELSHNYKPISSQDIAINQHIFKELGLKIQQLL